MLPRKGNASIDIATFVTFSGSKGMWPTMATAGWDDGGYPSTRDVAHWYIEGTTGTVQVNSSGLTQRPA